MDLSGRRTNSLCQLLSVVGSRITSVVQLLAFAGLLYVLLLPANVVPESLEVRTITGSSMAPIIPHGSEITVDKNYYKHRSALRGDITMFEWGSEFIVKKIHGIPGDTFTLRLAQDCGWNLVVNDVVVTNSSGEVYCFGAGRERVLNYLAEAFGGVIPPDHYLVLGEPALGGATDSSVVGLVEGTQLRGKIVEVMTSH